jgi:hypothetical protein
MSDTIYDIITLVILIIGSIVFFSMIGLDFNDKHPMSSKSIEKIITMESFQSTLIDEENANDDANRVPLCDNKSSLVEINERCKKISSGTNCKNSNCCIWLNDKSCVGGSENGPTYYTDDNKSEINVDYYYYKNKCYGNCN